MSHLIKISLLFLLFVICYLPAEAQRTINYWERGYKYEIFLNEVYYDYFHDTADGFNIFPLNFNQFSVQNDDSAKRIKTFTKIVKAIPDDSPVYTKNYWALADDYGKMPIQSQTTVNTFNHEGLLIHQLITTEFTNKKKIKNRISFRYSDSNKVVSATDNLIINHKKSRVVVVKYYFNKRQVADSIYYSFLKDNTNRQFSIHYQYDSFFLVKQIERKDIVNNKLSFKRVFTNVEMIKSSDNVDIDEDTKQTKNNYADSPRVLLKSHKYEPLNIIFKDFLFREDPPPAQVYSINTDYLSRHWLSRSRYWLSNYLQLIDLKENIILMTYYACTLNNSFVQWHKIKLSANNKQVIIFRSDKGTLNSSHYVACLRKMSNNPDFVKAEYISFDNSRNIKLYMKASPIDSFPSYDYLLGNYYVAQRKNNDWDVEHFLLDAKFRRIIFYKKHELTIENKNIYKYE